MRTIAGVLCAATGLLISACSDDSANAPAKNAAAPAQTGAVDGSMADGIYFERRELPQFVKLVSGISGHEQFGRWTDGPKAAIVFQQPLPTSFRLRLEVVGAFGPNVGKGQVVKIGGWEGRFEIVANKPQSFDFQVDTKAPTDTIEFVVFQPTSPKSLGANEDTRMLGFSLKRLSILPS